MLHCSIVDGAADHRCHFHERGFDEGTRHIEGPAPTRRPSGDRIMNLLKRIEHALLRRRECRRVRAELETYSERELNADLRLSRSDIPDLAARAGR
jgi:uncharacterized protein YjiS (DUF1127 family)